ncbi:MAG: hypothetical protein K2J46_09080, partial [Muribaculaceae bacterium]|nr:hypothetical protein [Muribaculaceae bacterium]
MRHKLILTMLLLLSLVAPVAALADSFYLNPADLEVDKTATLQFYLDNTMDCYGFQAEITFPDGIKPVKVGDKYDVTLSSNRVSDGKFEVESNILSNGNFIMGAYSANQKPFTGNNGVLVD